MPVAHIAEIAILPNRRAGVPVASGVYIPKLRNHRIADSSILAIQIAEIPESQNRRIRPPHIHIIEESHGMRIIDSVI